MKHVAFLLALLLMCTATCDGMALAANTVQENETEDGKGTSGLPLPRFASLRSDEVNMRTGPGTRYPIEWLLTRPGLPVEIIAEYDVWRRVRDPDGSEGWVHKSGLSGKRTAIITGTARDLHSDKNPASPLVAHLEVGAIGKIEVCAKDWCRLKFDDIKGRLPKTDFWGAYPGESFN
jgi:SH3-like domain-containing protein